MSGGLDIGVKLFHEVAGAAQHRDYIPIFHKWIQKRVLDELLIDVADYAHMHQGPGVILVCHDAIYGIDDEDGRRGLLYRRRRAEPQALEQELGTALAKLAAAAQALEREPELAGKVRFVTSEIEVSAFNRLRAPQRDETLAALRPGLERVLSPLLGGLSLSLVGEARGRFRVRASGKGLELAAWRPALGATLA